METASLLFRHRFGREQAPCGLLHPGDQRVLGAAEILRLDPAFGARTLECVRGELWITVEGQTEDVVLKAMQTLLLPAGKLVLVTALHPSVLGFNGSEAVISFIFHWASRAISYLRGKG